MVRRREAAAGPAWWLASAARDWWTDPATFDALAEAAEAGPEPGLEKGMLALKALGRKVSALGIVFGTATPPGADDGDAVPHFGARRPGDAVPPPDLVARVEAEDDERELRKITPRRPGDPPA